ncbi:CAAX amino terminal protease self- immunity [Peptococcaceae bacterium CEB3]|nr:CAAX amino terminal protease self- immunity [Peptococcaceae bacterium CEB3]
MNGLPQKAVKGQSEYESGRSPLTFFVLVFALAIPFWVVGAVTGLQLLPGLPVAALAAVCPGLAALLLVHHENRAAGAAVLLKRAFDYKRITAKVWYLPILLLMPVVMVLSFGVMRLTGTQVPAPLIEVLPTLILCVVFFIGALGEELGWSGYVIDPMQDRWGMLQASIVLGLIWAIYHYVALVQAHRSVAWIAWWSLGTVALRVIMVWFYNNTGKSVFAATLFHMTINVTWQVFPIHGSYYDPRVSGLILALLAVAIVVWRPRTLARHFDG